MSDRKINFDTQLDEETILPDKNCSICYGRGKMLISSQPTGPLVLKSFIYKECQCITRQRVHQARVKHFEQYKAA